MLSFCPYTASNGGAKVPNFLEKHNPCCAGLEKNKLNKRHTVSAKLTEKISCRMKVSFKKQTIGPELELSNWHNILNQSIRFWNLRLQYLLETLAKADDAMCESELCVGGSLELFYSLYYGSHSVPFDNNKQLTNVKRKPLNYLFQKPKSLPRLCSVLWQTPSNKAQPEAWPAVTQTFSDDKGRLVIRSYSIIGWF